MKILIYFICGFIWEALITSYHRCVISHRNVTASVLAMAITILSLLVVSHLTKEIIVGENKYVYLHVFVFAFGKGIGALISLSLWTKRHRKKEIDKKNRDDILDNKKEKGDCHG